MRQHTIRLRSRVASGALAVVLAAGLMPTTAFASESSDSSSSSTLSVVDDIVGATVGSVNTYLETRNADYLDSTYTWTTDEDASGVAAYESLLPSSFDLRDEGYVTSVKLQNPWGTCWGFASIAASETSILSELGITNDSTGDGTDAIDLSERHLAYFARTTDTDTDSSQYGEGVVVTGEGNAGIFNTGGLMFTATSVFSSGIGPVYEEDAPYQNDEGLMVNFNKEPTTDVSEAYYWSTEGTWSLDESLHFTQAVELEESSVLPTPATFTDDGTYVYDEAATVAIKSELRAGRAVAIGFCADTSRPGQETTAKYINTDTWAHYTYEKVEMTHAVTIVGWDDSYSASNFLEGHQPPGDGAWIVKNSWGAESNSFPNYGNWGDDGYFYLSYYDQTLSTSESFDYQASELVDGSDNDYYTIDQYDLMPSGGASTSLTDVKTSMANVFTADEDQMVRALSCETATTNTTVTYEVYLLNDDAESPTDGDLAATATETYEYGGYHRIDLDEGVPMRAGQRYSVVVTQTTSDGQYAVAFDKVLNEEGVTYFNENYSLGYGFYGVAVVNEGESFYYSEGDGWTDWTEVAAQVSECTADRLGLDPYDLDNLPVKAYADPYEFPSTYSDVDYTAWYGDSVDYVSSNGIMTGYAGTTLFGVGDELTRAQMAVVLWRLAEPEAAAAVKPAEDGAYEAVNETGLADVEDNVYYTAAVNWAIDAGAMHGVSHEDGSTTFEPDAPATVEQLATVLWNYSQAGAGDVAALSTFTDGSEASDWAQEAVAWCVQQHYINGYLNEDGSRTLLPREDVARERMAAIVANAHKAGLFG